MEQQPAKKRRPMHLPFEKRQGASDWGEWIYKHRFGVMATVIVYLMGTIAFLSYRIVLNESHQQMITIEFQSEPEPPNPEPTPEEIKQLEIEKLHEREMEKISNRVSDANSKLNSELRDAKNSNASEIYKEAERVNRELAKGREAYEKGLREAEAAAASGKVSNRNKDKDKERKDKEEQNQGNQRTKASGIVTIEYDLANRHDVYLHRPTYQCQYGGTVVVAITVNRNGKVIDATPKSVQTQSNDGCIEQMAVQSARASTFNVSMSAPEKQKGTITYKFMAQ